MHLGTSLIKGLEKLGVLVSAILCVSSCSRPRAKADAHASSSRSTAATEPSAPLPASAPLPNGHDPSHPPIDCPLRKQGLKHEHGHGPMRPFADVEKYIAMLERPDRLAWQKPDEVVSALQLKGTEQVFDLGAGSGYFSFRFAKALPEGKVVAGDPEAEMIRHMHHRAMTEGVKNVETKLIEASDPSVPQGTDLVFLCDVLHHVPERPAWLLKLASQLKPGARVAIIEFKEGSLPEGPPESLKIPRQAIFEQMTSAGFVLDEEYANVLPYQLFLIFRKQ